ncbi:hypothetical protein FN846DRAFT_779565 [Sphaerosporella brunnea]|uniref:J domain-containing protein n=1 Tax=Sphaerosporella brunnea TaxID=1250544 RepID=A0A5J5EUZ7_9PEZI|nr:hypothetical protein FN846DRAFT_779565 [Sphaerosporella brunnea]
MSSTVLSFLGWTFLPNWASTWIVYLWYRIITRAGDPMPQPGTPRYVHAHRRVFALVVSLYLLYTIYEAYLNLIQTPNFYDLLSVPYTVTPQELKSRFRRLTVLYHPDKVGAQGAEKFVRLKLAYDTLSDSTTRFAYDRFGTAILEWKHCTTLYDYVQHGVLALIPSYALSLIVLVILSVLGKFELGRWWRYYVFIALATFELTLMSRPYTVLPDIPFVKPLLAFEAVELARKIALTSFIALNQLGPSLMKDNPAASATQALEARLGQLVGLAGFVEKEAAMIQHTELLPFEQDAAVMKRVERRVGEWLVENQVRNDPEVRDALGKALQRRRQGAPAGARGTK